MAMRILERPKTLTASLMGSLDEGLQAYGEYKKREKGYSKISDALQTVEGFDKKKADAWAKSGEKTLGELLSLHRKQKAIEGKGALQEKLISSKKDIFGAKESKKKFQKKAGSAVAQSYGVDKNVADLVMESENQSLLNNILKNTGRDSLGQNLQYQHGTNPAPSLSQLQSQFDQEQSPMQQMGQNPMQQQQQQQMDQDSMSQMLESRQEPMGQQTPTQEQIQLGMDPRQMMQAQAPQTQLSVDGKMPVEGAIELRGMIQEALKSGEITKQEANSFIKSMRLNKATASMIIGNKLHKKVAMALLKMANQDPEKARKLARNLGYRS